MPVERADRAKGIAGVQIALEYTYFSPSKMESAMNYALYPDRKPGDRIADQSGRLGIVTEIRGPMTGHDCIAVKWDDGRIARNYVKPQQLTLLLRMAPTGRIPKPKLAEMLTKRGR